MGYKYTDDDNCDIYENKICDNCGKCLESEGVDIRAIGIEDIAKTVEENKILEEEYMNSLRENEFITESEEFNEESVDPEEYKSIADAYKKFQEEHNINLDEEEYEDAFDHIDPLEQEIFPGVRKLKSNK